MSHLLLFIGPWGVAQYCYRYYPLNHGIFRRLHEINSGYIRSFHKCCFASGTTDQSGRGKNRYVLLLVCLMVDTLADAPGVRHVSRDYSPRHKC